MILHANRNKFKKMLEQKQWSGAATVSVSAIKAGDAEERDWYLLCLMATCNRWRVLRMVKTWLAHDIVFEQGLAFDRFHDGYRTSVFGVIGEYAVTKQQQQCRSKFLEIRFQPYDVVDPLVYWLMSKTVDNLAV